MHLLSHDCIAIVNITRNCLKHRKVTCEYLACYYIYFLNAVRGLKYILLIIVNHTLFHHRFFEHIHIFTLAC